jgi:tetratricopeptide (TPR) repeat protein
VVAVAGRPVERLVAWHAAALDAEMSDPLVGLKALRMLSTTQMSLNDEWLEVYDEHIGKAVQSQITTAAQCSIFLKLAVALEASPGSDAETLADWYEQAGESEKASSAAEMAAVRAMGVLAFERAARLFSRALAGKRGTEFARLLKAGADALALAGRSKEAASTYLSLVELVSPHQKLDYQRRAAELLLHSGHFEEGITVLKSVLHELGEVNPESRRNARWFAIYNRLRVQWRGLNFTLREEKDVPPQDLLRVDAYWAAAKGYGLIDPMRGNAFQFVHCRHALDCGEPYRVGRALALEAGFHALQGLSHREQALNVLGQLRVLIDAHPNDHLEGLHTLMSGCEALGQGRFHEGRPHFERAEALFREKCPGMTWESSTALQYLVQSELFLGEFSEMRTRTRETETSAQARGDVYALTNIRVRAVPWVRLMADDPQGARSRVEDALNSFVREGYFVQHYWGLFVGVASYFYEGKHAEAKRLFDSQLEDITESGLLRIQLARIVTRFQQGCVALAVKDTKGAEHAWRRLDREKVTAAAGLAGVLKGAVMAMEGDAPAASLQLARSEELLQSVGMNIYAKAAMRGRGLTVKGQDGAALVAAADQFFAQRGVKRPEAYARMLLPGPW